MVVDHGRDHHLVGLRRFDQRIEPRAHGRDRAGVDALAVQPDALQIDRRVGVRGGLLGTRERQIFALLAAHEIEIDGGGEPVGFGFGVGRDRGNAEDRVRAVEGRRRAEFGAVAHHGGDRIVGREMMGEGERRADHRRKLGAVAARSEEINRRQRHVRRHRAHVAERMTFRIAVLLDQQQLLKAFEEIVIVANILAPPQRE